MFVTLKVVDLGIAMCYKFCSSIKENRQLLLVSFVGLTKVLIGQSHKKGGQGLGMSAPIWTIAPCCPSQVEKGRIKNLKKTKTKQIGLKIHAVPLISILSHPINLIPPRTQIESSL